MLFHLLQHPEIASSLKGFTEGKQKLEALPCPVCMAGLDRTGEHVASATRKKAVIRQEQTHRRWLPGLPMGFLTRGSYGTRGKVFLMS